MPYIHCQDVKASLLHPRPVAALIALFLGFFVCCWVLVAVVNTMVVHAQLGHAGDLVLAGVLSALGVVWEGAHRHAGRRLAERTKD